MVTGEEGGVGMLWWEWGVWGGGEGGEGRCKWSDVANGVRNGTCMEESSAWEARGGEKEGAHTRGDVERAREDVAMERCVK